MQALKKRSEIPEEECWDLSALFSDDKSCEAQMNQAAEDARAFCERYQGQLGEAGADLLLSAVRDYEQLMQLMERAFTYASLRESTDMTETAAVKLSSECQMKGSQIFSELSFFDGELARAPKASLEEAMRKAPEYGIYLKDILDWQPHLLAPETEKALAALSPALDAPYNVYEMSKAADMAFPDFEAHGKKYPLSYVLYENNYSGDTDTERRRNAFSAFSETLRRYRNTTAAAYNAQVQKENILAKLRGFDSVFDYLLYEQKVSRELYDRHLDITMEKLGPIMRRWAALIKKEHSLEEIHYSDLKLGLDPEYAPTVSIEESKAYIQKAMEPMGREYQEMVLRAFPERWVDFAQNIGKSTGGFCTTPFNAHPYILLNWNGNLSEVFTLVHELGHAAQGLLCQKHNRPLQADFTLYDVEAPSTFHEMLLSHSLLKSAKDERFRRWVLASMIENTYYHNFVTHFLEGYYQREVYRLVDKGQSLTADDLDAIYLETLKKFWGDAVILDEGAELTWMRQPHYYMGLYSYTYSCSLVISTEMFQRLQKEGEAAVSDWLSFLSTGGPTAPALHCRKAGIEIEDGKALLRTLDFISSVISDLEA